MAQFDFFSRPYLNLNTKIEPAKLQRLEEKYSLYLPNKFKSFINFFQIGKNLFRNELYFVERYNKYADCTFVSFPNELDFELSEFLDISSIFEHHKSHIGYGTEDYENKLIKISTINKGGAIFVGNGITNIDEIYVNLWDNDPCHYKIASDIFDFIEKCELKYYKESDLIDNLEYNQFYKNWKDEFWRIRI